MKEPALANAKSVEWTIKFTSAPNEIEEKHLPPVELPLGGEDPLKLSYAFEHAGTYEITDVVHTDALAGEVVRPSIPDTVTVTGKELSVKFTARRNQAPSARTNKRPNSRRPSMTRASRKGRRSPSQTSRGSSVKKLPLVLTEQKVNNGVKGNLILHHALGRCKTAKCKVQVSVKEAAGSEGFAGQSEQAEITVTESLAEEAARHAKEAAEAAQHAKEAQEAAQHAKEAEEAAQRAKAAQEAAQHAKEAEEAARKAKEAEETRIGLLAYQVSAAPQSSISVNSSGVLS